MIETINIDFNKSNGLVPAIIQDFASGRVLMLGYMNQEALETTQREGKVTFFSRSKNRLWTKGETSGNFLLVKDILLDCDGDALLVKAQETGPVCHTGSPTCFQEGSAKGFFYTLEEVIRERQANAQEGSYTAELLCKGINKIAQKVGEEAIELVIEAKDNNKNLFLNEAADLLYHLLVLLRFKNANLEDVETVLQARQLNK